MKLENFATIVQEQIAELRKSRLRNLELREIKEFIEIVTDVVYAEPGAMDLVVTHGHTRHIAKRYPGPPREE